MREIIFCGLLTGAFAILFCSVKADAQSIPRVEETRAKIVERIENHSDFYGDVLPTYSCKKPKLTYDKLLCANKDLQLLEKLYRMTAVYATENATKSETNHKTFFTKSWFRRVRNRLKTQQQVLDYFVEEINSSLGGESPFYLAAGTRNKLN